MCWPVGHPGRSKCANYVTADSCGVKVVLVSASWPPWSSWPPRPLRSDLCPLSIRFNHRSEDIAVNGGVFRPEVGFMGAHRAGKKAGTAVRYKAQVFLVDEEAAAEGTADDVAAGVEVDPAPRECRFLGARTLLDFQTATNRGDR